MDTSTDRLLAKGEREALAAYDADHPEPAHGLTRNPVDGSWGFVCTEHGIHRHGLPEAHAINVERKHLREEHPDPLNVSLDLRAAAEHVLADHDAGKLAMWKALTGMNTEHALALAVECATSPTPIILAVAPF